MPYKRKTKKKKSFRRRRFRKKTAQPTMLINRGATIVPDRFRTKLRYTFRYKDSNTLDGKVFRGNSVFDPYHAVGGQYPMGFTQLATLYSRYMVHGSSIKVLATNISTTTSALLSIVPSCASTGFTNFNESTEATYSRHCLLAPGASHARMMKHYMTTRKIRGIRTNKIDDDELESLVTANPVKEWYWHVTTGSFDGTTGQGTEVEVTIVYYVDFFKRKDQDTG